MTRQIPFGAPGSLWGRNLGAWTGVLPSPAPVLNLRNLDRAEMADALASLGSEPRLWCSGSLRPCIVSAPLGSRPVRCGASPMPRPRRSTQACEWPDLEIIERRRAADGFVKYLFRTADGHAIEAVRIPLPDPADARALKERRRAGQAAGLAGRCRRRSTSSVSARRSAARSPATSARPGAWAGIRSLKTWEILAQHRLIAAEADHPVRGAVFMGMGEPLLNYENVIRAARILCDPAGPAISAKAISISTAGVLPAIRRFTAEGHHFRLILSLGAPTAVGAARADADRGPLAGGRGAGRRSRSRRGAGRARHARLRGHRRRQHLARARACARRAAGRNAGQAELDRRHRRDRAATERATDEELDAFRDALAALGIPVARRYSGGAEIGAACGTLAATRQGGQDAVVQIRLESEALSTTFAGAWPARRRAGGRSSPCRSARRRSSRRRRGRRSDRCACS